MGGIRLRRCKIATISARTIWFGGGGEFGKQSLEKKSGEKNERKIQKFQSQINTMRCMFFFSIGNHQKTQCLAQNCAENCGITDTIWNGSNFERSNTYRAACIGAILTVGNLLHFGGVDDQSVRVATLYVRAVFVLLLEDQIVADIELFHQVERRLLLDHSDTVLRGGEE